MRARSETRAKMRGPRAGACVGATPSRCPRARARRYWNFRKSTWGGLASQPAAPTSNYCCCVVALTQPAHTATRGAPPAFSSTCAAVSSRRRGAWRPSFAPRRSPRTWVESVRPRPHADVGLARRGTCRGASSPSTPVANARSPPPRSRARAATTARPRLQSSASPPPPRPDARMTRTPSRATTTTTSTTRTTNPRGAAPSPRRRRRRSLSATPRTCSRYSRWSAPSETADTSPRASIPSVEASGAPPRPPSPPARVRRVSSDATRSSSIADRADPSPPPTVARARFALSKP